MSTEGLNTGWCDEFPLLDLPILVVEKIIRFIVDPLDLKSLRRTCHLTRDVIDRNPEALLCLRVTPKDLKTLEQLVASDKSHIKWNNVRFPPELYYVGCRRHYFDTFNKLFASFAVGHSAHLQILEMDRFDLSNANHVNLLRSCPKLVSFKADAMHLKGVSEQRLCEILQDKDLTTVLEHLVHLDVTAFEFLSQDYQFEFMGKLLGKCTNLESLGSWGYFPEWEQPIGGTIHLKHFLWPLVLFLRGRFPGVVDRLLRYEQGPLVDLSNLDPDFLTDVIDWQLGKWVLDLKREPVTQDLISLETFIYSRIKSYSNGAVGWFDEDEFRKSGLSLMTNLTEIHIRNARDIQLTGRRSPFDKPLFPKLESLTLIVGNRLGCLKEPQGEGEEEEGIPLEKVVVDMLLNSYRPNVTQLKLDIDLDHHQCHGSIQLQSLTRNFSNLTSCTIEEWGPTDEHILEMYEAFPRLEVLMFCGRNLTDRGILGREPEEAEQSTDCCGIRKLKKLRILKIYSIRIPPKNVFPWPTKENNNITDLSFQHGFSHMQLRKFHFLLKSSKISSVGLSSLTTGNFSKCALEFAMNWLPKGVDTHHQFERIHNSFHFIDVQSEPANFVIPDIGKWVL